MYTIIKVFAIALLFFHWSFISPSSAGKSKDTETAITIKGGDNIRTKTDALVVEKLVNPYKSKVKDEGLERRKFSRCPSGYRYYADKLASNETEYSYGEFHNYVGCRPQEICKYRARLSDNTVEVLQSDGVNYMAADLWLNNVTSSSK